MQTLERSPQYSNYLVDAPSLYLRMHAHNPVLWYPWGEEALARAKAENKPIFLSIGYSSCYWCHVMAREVFNNVSIAAMMNRLFINIKVDREEHPEIDLMYMMARQVLKGEGGWPNNVFLLPDLRPFYAGGIYGVEDSLRRPSLLRLLEWVDVAWRAQDQEMLTAADKLTNDMRFYLTHTQPAEAEPIFDTQKHSDDLFKVFRRHYDSRSGGFFQSPKFPYECYLQFLLGYHEATDTQEAYNMVVQTLTKMAAGGIQDHVGCGFHRYTVDKEWFIPHFEKMLFTQAQLARVYTDAAQVTDDAYLADIAKSILDFVSGPMTSGTGGFYTAVDAETDGVEGAYYVWTLQELREVLTPEEMTILMRFYALTEFPAFPGHQHPGGMMLVARKPLDLAAYEAGAPYIQIAAMVGMILNKLLEVRNKRVGPYMDDKILVGCNGLMIDAFAHAGRVFQQPKYIEKARSSLDFLLEHLVDNNGNLKRMYALGMASGEATLEDFAFLIKGILSLWRAAPDDGLLTAAKSFAEQVKERFGSQEPGYYFTQSSDTVLFRMKTGDDSAIPGGNAVMAHNLLDLYEITQELHYLEEAKRLIDFFVRGNTRISVEYATIMHAALRLHSMSSPRTLGIRGAVGTAGKPKEPFTSQMSYADALEDPVTVSAVWTQGKPMPDTECSIMVIIAIKEGWAININRLENPFLIPTQVDVQGKDVEVVKITYPAPSSGKALPESSGKVVSRLKSPPQYKDFINIIVHVRLPKEHSSPVQVQVRYQPCQGMSCYQVQDVVVVL